MADWPDVSQFGNQGIENRHKKGSCMATRADVTGDYGF
jgi:hypothetical protein